MNDNWSTKTICSVGICMFLVIIVCIPHVPALADPSAGSSVDINVRAVNVSKQGSPSGAASELSLTEFQQQVLEYLEKGQSAAAKKLVESKRAKEKGTDPELLYLLAYINSQTGNCREAVKQLREALRQESSSTDRYRAFQAKCLGDCYFHMGRTDQALTQYKHALLLIKGNEPDPLQADILESLSGCLMENGNFAEAETFGERLLACCQVLAHDNQLANIGTLFWSQIGLLQIYKRQGEKAKYDQLYRSFIPLLQRLMSLRAELDAPLSLSEKVDFPLRLNKIMLSQYVAQHNPKTLPEYLWLSASYRLRGLPLISWETAAGTKPKAAILCVHGLGLENRDFESFATEMTERNFVVYAMDVRGFGAWQSEFGSKTVSFGRTLSDIRTVIKLIKEQSPQLPVFLLGESMGGALVLRAASEFGGDLNGVIASVPSAERYGESRMAMSVATHLLRHPNRPFNIGAQVAAQATSSEELRTMWEKDPLAKQELSPIELIKFNRFMIATQKKCSLIKSTPVLVVQGLADRLVKPKGSYEMFDNVNSPDRALLIIGNAEHLIFETPHQSPILLDGLTAWLNNHVSSGNQ